MAPMEEEIIVVAALFARPGRHADMASYEAQATAVLREHGGRVERAIRPRPPGGDRALPDEVHVLAFPSVEAFDAYRRDPRLAELAETRAEAIERTVVWTGNDVSEALRDSRR